MPYQICYPDPPEGVTAPMSAPAPAHKPVWGETELSLPVEIVVNKRRERIRYADETEDSVTIVIKLKEAVEYLVPTTTACGSWMW